MSTNLVKFDNTARDFTSYCSDDTGETEIGPAKWDDANNKLEINCDSTDFQVKWDDANNRLEARNVSADCCNVISGGCCGSDCDVMPKYLTLAFSGIENCGTNDVSSICGGCCDDCEDINGNFTLEWADGCSWRYSSGCKAILALILGYPNWTVDARTVAAPCSQVCFYNEGSYINPAGCGVCDALPLTLYNDQTVCFYGDPIDDLCYGINGSVVISEA